MKKNHGLKERKKGLADVGSSVQSGLCWIEEGMVDIPSPIIVER